MTADTNGRFVAQRAVLQAIREDYSTDRSWPERATRCYTRKNPGKLLFASGGNGSSPHLAGELFKRMTGTQMTHVPYKGSPQGITDMIGGQVHLMFDNASSIGPHVRSERVRGLAITSATRSPSYPELPTVAESGVPNFEMVAWRGIIAPAGVPKAIVLNLR